MRGTLVNCLAVIVGSSIGLLVKKGIKESYQTSIAKALGVSVVIIGLNGVITNMVTVSVSGELASSGEMLLVISLVLGTLIGELLKLEDNIERLSLKVENKLRVNGFSSGFVSATVLFCVGAMAIVGSLNDGLSADPSVLYLKSALDFVSSAVLSSALGFGVMFAAIPVLLYQGSISLLSGLLSGLLIGPLLKEICMTGYAIILCIGINFIFPKKIKTANMLPSMLIPVIWHYISLLIK